VKIEEITRVLLNVGKLKSLKRTGWVRENIPDPESVAEHTFRVCFLVLLLSKKLKLDENRLLKMALVHDLEEVITGDPVTQRFRKDIGEHDEEREKNIIRKILGELDNSDEIYRYWEEHLQENKPGASRNASILYQVGKIATVWQALEYELNGQNPKVMEEWWENARHHINAPFLVQLLNNMEELRKNGK
jgi:5'-deoxynucleotidase YfbR-like HD superfamily hydrolase